MTITEHAHFAEWDAAYVLGALSPAERREFEDHLEDCERCRAAVTELSGMPGLLGRIDDARAFALLELGDAVFDDHEAQPEPEPEPPSTVDLVTRIRANERRSRLRRTVLSVGALAAAAALASVLTVAVPAALAPTTDPDLTVGMSSADQQPIPIDVFVGLTSTGWGTKLKMDCIYHPTGNANAAGNYGPGEYSLWVVDADGTEQSVSTWSSAPGSEVVLEAATATPLGDITQVDLRNADGSQVLMTSPVSMPG
jgi:hypothetical protein